MPPRRRAAGGEREEERVAPYDKSDFAIQSRHAVTPVECVAEGQCWVKFGGTQHLHMGVKGTGGTPRCIGCGGKLLLDRWRTPEALGLPTYGGRVGRLRSAPDQRQGE